MCKVLPLGGFGGMMSFKKNLIKSRNYFDADRLASKMLFNKRRLVQSMRRWMRSLLINKNLCLYYWLRKRIGKKLAFYIAILVEKGLLILGREAIQYFEKNQILTEQGGSVFKSIYSEQKDAQKLAKAQIFHSR